MPAKDLGAKHTCWKCGTKFYDLKKPDPACPKCGADPRAAPVVKPASAAAEKRRARQEPEEIVSADLEEADVEEEAEEVADADEAADDE